MINAQAAGIKEISTEGFQVVGGEMFKHATRKSEPSCSISFNSISFNKMSVSALNSCERVRIEINPKTKCVLIVPVTAKDKDGIRWTKNIKEPVGKKMECRAFTTQLYEMWRWEPELGYRAIGEIVCADKKVMLLYDFSEPEVWKCKEQSKAQVN